MGGGADRLEQWPVHRELLALEAELADLVARLAATPQNDDITAERLCVLEERALARAEALGRDLEFLVEEAERRAGGRTGDQSGGEARRRRQRRSSGRRCDPKPAFRRRAEL